MSSISGIYVIRNKKTNTIYIGSSSDIRQRFRSHRNHLRRNKHKNSYMQNSWNKYGEKAFEFKIIETCDRFHLFEREQIWIDRYLPRGNCFNMLKVAGGIMAGMSMTAEHKKKLSEAALNRSDEVKAKRAFARRRRYIMTSPEGEQFEILGLVEFCSQHNLSVSNLCTVASGRLVHYKGWKCQKIS